MRSSLIGMHGLVMGGLVADVLQIQAPGLGYREKRPPRQHDDHVVEWFRHQRKLARAELDQAKRVRDANVISAADAKRQRKQAKRLGASVRP